MSEEIPKQEPAPEERIEARPETIGTFAELVMELAYPSNLESRKSFSLKELPSLYMGEYSIEYALRPDLRLEVSHSTNEWLRKVLEENEEIPDPILMDILARNRVQIVKTYPDGKKKIQTIDLDLEDEIRSYIHWDHVRSEGEDSLLNESLERGLDKFEATYSGDDEFKRVVEDFSIVTEQELRNLNQQLKEIADKLEDIRAHDESLTQGDRARITLAWTSALSRKNEELGKPPLSPDGLRPLIKQWLKDGMAEATSNNAGRLFSVGNMVGVDPKKLKMFVLEIEREIASEED